MPKKALQYPFLLLYGILFFGMFGITPAYPLFLIALLFGFHLLELELIFRSVLKHNVQYVQQHLREITTSHDLSTLTDTLFFLLYFPLLLFVMTSTGSLVGLGFMLGLGCRYLSELVMRYRTPDQIVAIYLPTFKNDLQLKHVQWGVIAFCVIFCGITVNLFI